MRITQHHYRALLAKTWSSSQTPNNDAYLVNSSPSNKRRHTCFPKSCQICKIVQEILAANARQFNSEQGIWHSVGVISSRMLGGSAVSSSFQPHGLLPARLLCPWDFPGKNTRVGCHFLLQGIFPIRGSNLCLLRLRHGQADSLLLPQLGSPGVI